MTFRPVKEELVTDSSPLPMSNGRVVCWLELSQVQYNDCIYSCLCKFANEMK